MAILKKFPPSDLEIPLTKSYPEETPRIHRGICTRIFTVIYNKTAETTQRSDKKKSYDGGVKINHTFGGYLMTQGNTT